MLNMRDPALKRDGVVKIKGELIRLLRLSGEKLTLRFTFKGI